MKIYSGSVCILFWVQIVAMLMAVGILFKVATREMQQTKMLPEVDRYPVKHNTESAEL